MGTGVLNQNYQVSLNLLSSNCQTPPTDSNENSQNRIRFDATNELYNAYLVIFLVVRVRQYDRLRRITVELKLNFEIY